MREFRKAHQFIVFTVHTPSQHAIADYMALGTHNELANFYQAKRDLFLSQLEKSRLDWQPSHGTYFVSARYANVEEFSKLSDTDFAQHLARKVGVACIPISAFYHGANDQQLVRFCFAKREATLTEAAKRLMKI